MRLGKQVILDIVNEMDIYYGTTNRLNPQVIFINGKFWVEPTEEMEYTDVVNSIASTMKNRIRYKLKNNHHWDSKIIFDMDIKTVSMSIHRKTYGDFELYLKQKNNNILPLNQLKGELMDLLTPLMNEFVSELQINDFIVTKTKK